MSQTLPIDKVQAAVEAGDMRIFCCDCREDLTPTSLNNLGWFYHAMGGHQVIAVETAGLAVLGVIPKGTL